MEHFLRKMAASPCAGTLATVAVINNIAVKIFEIEYNNISVCFVKDSSTAAYRERKAIIGKKPMTRRC